MYTPCKSLPSVWLMGITPYDIVDLLKDCLIAAEFEQMS